jgi:ankyrin repeat protein
MTTKEELFKAVEKCNLAKVQQMIEADPSLINARDYYGSTLLHKAAMFGCVDLVAWLLDKGVDVNARDKEGNTPLLLAVDFSYFTPFVEGKLEGISARSETVALLLRRGAGVHAKNVAGYTAFAIATKPADPGYYDIFPAYKTIQEREYVVRILRKHGAIGSSKQGRKASLGCGIMALVVVAIAIIIFLV